MQTDLEEAKSQEISKLEAAITELQALNTNAVSEKERIISRQVPTIKETEVTKMIEVSSSKVEKLQAENERLMVIPYFRNPVVLPMWNSHYLSVFHRFCHNKFCSKLIRLWL